MAATAYAALRSLLTTIAMEKTPSPLNPPFPFPEALIDALLEMVQFMVDFLEQDYRTDAEHLMSRITQLAYAAEDAIELPILDLIRSSSASDEEEGSSSRSNEEGGPEISHFRSPSEKRFSSRGPEISYFRSPSDETSFYCWNEEDESEMSCRDFYEAEGSEMSSREELGTVPLGQDLESIINDLDLIKAEMLLLIKDKSIGMIQEVHPGGSRSSTNSSTAHRQCEKAKMVGLEEEKSKIIGELTWHDHQRGLRIIPIIGMGGIGKTTLVRNVYDDDHIMKHFDVRAWVTVSQQYNVNDILSGILSSIKNGASVGNSGELVHKSLFNRRYLVVFDDMWSTDVWDGIKQFFPDNNNGSRIMVTTRLSNVAAELSTGFRLGMKCLDVENSWNLFCQKVFVSKSCPLELDDVGKKIVRNCGGLPLAIVVTGGLLAKSSQTLKYWEHVAEDLHSCLYSSDDDHCSKILSPSYNHLPVYLKPCLLYLGVFLENHRVHVSQLMRLWIAEGFVKPLEGRTLEEVAEEYLEDLIGRNLIMVSSFSWKGKTEYVVIHDLMRELYLREAQREMFYSVVVVDSLEAPVSMLYPRRIVILASTANSLQHSYLRISLRSASHVRSLILHVRSTFLCLGSFDVNLLRVLFSITEDVTVSISGNIKPRLFNMRFVAGLMKSNIQSRIGPSRNLQLLPSTRRRKPIEMWNQVQLRYIKLPLVSMPPYHFEDQHNYIALENLQSLGTLEDFRFSEEAMRRIPNVKKLKVSYWTIECEEWSHYNAHNIECLKKLESFSCEFFALGPRNAPSREEFVRSLVFPPSLKKLSLEGCRLIWDDMTVLASLPQLEVLKLHCNSFVGPEWNPTERGFRRLKFFRMTSIYDLMNWNADDTHFPCLEKLSLHCCVKLKQIPLDLGEISTLRLIEVSDCSVSAMMSAKSILEEQQSFGNDDLVVEVTSWCKYRSIHDVKINNFVATSWSQQYAESDNEEESDDNKMERNENGEESGT